MNSIEGTSVIKEYGRGREEGNGGKRVITDESMEVSRGSKKVKRKMKAGKTIACVRRRVGKGSTEGTNERDDERNGRLCNR